MTSLYEPQDSTPVVGGAVHKTRRHYEPNAYEESHPTSEWVHAPDMDLIDDGYWKVSGTSIVAMTQAEKDAFDAEQERLGSGNVIAAIVVDPVVEPVVPGASKVVSNDRPAIEVQDGVTGWGAIQGLWPRQLNAAARACIKVLFILAESGTGSKVRIAARAKAQGLGEDSSASFADTDFEVVTVTHTTIGEVFRATVELDASGFELRDAVALQVGRDGNNELGAGDNDDVSVAVQIIGVEARAK